MGKGKFSNRLHFSFISGRVNLKTIQSLKNRLQAECSVPAEMTDHIDWFFARCRYEGAFPVIVTISENGALHGVLFLFERKILGIRTGMYSSPYQCGFGSYLGRSGDVLPYARAAALFVASRPRTISVQVWVRSSPAELNTPQDLDAFAGNNLNENCTRIEKGSYFPLRETLDETLANFSHKSRRNFRYFNKKATQNYGCVLKCNLTDGEAIDAVQTLNARSSRQMSVNRAKFRCLVTRQRSGSFSAGLTDENGIWLSYIAGWRADGICYIDWQINKEDTNQISFSAVMRSRWIEAEIARGTTALYFLGGSNKTWENACLKHEVDLIQIKRTGAAIAVGQEVVTVAARLRPINRIRVAINAALSKG